MPRGDRTGPNGMGPMTGRGAGYCAGYSRPGYMNNLGGRGFFGCGRGIGFGAGRGWRNIFRATGLTGRQRAGMVTPPEVPTAQDELSALKQQAADIECMLGDIKNRISELEK